LKAIIDSRLCSIAQATMTACWSISEQNLVGIDAAVSTVMVSSHHLRIFNML